MDFTSKLNDNQKEAVLHTEGPLLILAGAGSGKTRVITNRIAHLVKNNDVKPWQIFAVTFTNKAAAEMKERIIDLIGSEGNSVFAKTFHSASVSILRKYSDRLGIGNSFSIYDGSDQQTVIKGILNELKIDPKKFKPSMFTSKISEVKDKAALSGARIDLLLPDNYPFDFTEIYKLYHERLKENNALDFNDLLIKTVELLRDHKDVLEELQYKWRYFMVDEYQDTNHAQYMIAKFLAEKSRNICVVGDDDQSIYSWRGADITNILNFEKDYEEAKTITLEENYRSTQPILRAASAVIQNNSQRKNKKLKAFKGEGEIATWCQTNNEYGEAEFVVNTIVSMKYKENYKNKDFAIFYRTNAQSRVFEDRLRREGIPYRVVGGLKFYDRKEIKDIIAYLKFIANPTDSISMLRIINTPTRGIGKTTVEKISMMARSQEMSEWEIIEEGFLTGKIPKGLTAFQEMATEAIKIAKTIPTNSKLSELVTHIVNESGYRKNLQELNNTESKTRLENIDEFINGIFDYETERPNATLSEFLQDVSLLTSEENPQENPDDINNIVTLMTIHNSKGLEFPVVFLTGMEENTFPHIFSIDTPEGIEEERRLCYVGITRAMDKVFLTNAELRRSFTNTEFKQPSRFIFEIPSDILEVKEFSSENGSSFSNRKSNYNASKSSYSTSKSFSKKTITRERTENSPLLKKLERTEPKKNDSKYKIKDRIAHPKYGFGIIKKIEGKGDNTKLIISFSSGEKKLAEKYTPLEKV